MQKLITFGLAVGAVVATESTCDASAVLRTATKVTGLDAPAVPTDALSVCPSLGTGKDPICCDAKTVNGFTKNIQDYAAALSTNVGNRDISYINIASDGNPGDKLSDALTSFADAAEQLSGGLDSLITLAASADPTAEFIDCFAGLTSVTVDEKTATSLVKAFDDAVTAADEDSSNALDAALAKAVGTKKDMTKVDATELFQCFEDASSLSSAEVAAFVKGLTPEQMTLAEATDVATCLKAASIDISAADLQKDVVVFDGAYEIDPELFDALDKLDETSLEAVINCFVDAKLISKDDATELVDDLVAELIDDASDMSDSDSASSVRRLAGDLASELSEALAGISDLSGLMAEAESVSGVDVSDLLAEASDMLGDAFANLNSSSPLYAMKSQIDDLTAAMVQSHDEFVAFQNDRATCVKALLAAQAAVWCLSCNPDATSKGLTVNKDGSLTIAMSSTMCQNLTGSCYDYLVGSQAQESAFVAYPLIQQLEAGAATLAKGGNPFDNFTAVPADGSISVMPEGCKSEDDCDWICTDLFSNGLVNLNNLAAGGDTGSGAGATIDSLNDFDVLDTESESSSSRRLSKINVVVAAPVEPISFRHRNLAGGSFDSAQDGAVFASQITFKADPAGQAEKFSGITAPSKSGSSDSSNSGVMTFGSVFAGMVMVVVSMMM